MKAMNKKVTVELVREVRKLLGEISKILKVFAELRNS